MSVFVYIESLGQGQDGYYDVYGILCIKCIVFAFINHHS
jgi:hypothetical protein